MPKKLVSMLDLRFAGATDGSFRMFITGNLSPNLFGYSLLEETLESTFRVLQSENGDQLTEAVAEIGARSATEMKRLMDDLLGAGVAAELKWETPQKQRVEWTADQRKLRKLADSLSQIVQQEPEFTKIEGEVALLSDKGRISIRPPRGKAIALWVPADQFDKIRYLRLKDKAVADVRVDHTVNQLTGVDKTTYTVIDINRAKPLNKDPA